MKETDEEGGQGVGGGRKVDRD
jgi:hypothetical protein